jgi:hypothetical protein
VALLAMLFLGTGSEKFKMAAAKTGITCISASIQDSKEIPTAIRIFWGQHTQWRYREGFILKPEVRFLKWRRQTGSTFISASIQDIKEIPEDSPMFSEAGKSMAILVMHYLETGSQIFKMAVPNRKYLYLNFYAR